jgi:type IV pilus secretin PilQ/predicted competence protein
MKKIFPIIYALLAGMAVVAHAQTESAEPAPAAISAPVDAPLVPEQPAPIEPPVMSEFPSAPSYSPAPTPAPADAALVPSGTPTMPPSAMDVTMPTAGGLSPSAPGTTSMVTDFQGDEVGQVLRLLARQAKINLVVSELIAGTVTMRLENVTPLEAIRVICTSKNLILDELGGVYYVKTQQEKAAEPTKSDFYTFSFAMAEKIAPLLQSQLRSGVPPQFDSRTNTIFYRESESNMDAIKTFLETVDTPTQQVMIEARLVEVTVNPNQSYGINWAGVFGSKDKATIYKIGGSIPIDDGGPLDGATYNENTGSFSLGDFVGVPENSNPFSGTIRAFAGQFAIMSMPQFSATLRLLNEDKDAEFLANPRVVAANNMTAKIQITRNQPVPQLNFNEQTATSVFGGFEDKVFGNTLEVTPSVNKDDFITMNVKPEISNKVADATFVFRGDTVVSPIIDTRVLESSVLIKSGDTLAIGGLLQDEVTKGRTKVPILGDIPILGYAFQERLNGRTKRNLLVFVTPTIIKQGYGTGLENQVTGVHHSAEEYADPNGWRNNARGAVRWVPTSNRQVAADAAAPGIAPQPKKAEIRKNASTTR